MAERKSLTFSTIFLRREPSLSGRKSSNLARYPYKRRLIPAEKTTDDRKPLLAKPNAVGGKTKRDRLFYLQIDDNQPVGATIIARAGYDMMAKCCLSWQVDYHKVKYLEMKYINGRTSYTLANNRL